MSYIERPRFVGFANSAPEDRLRQNFILALLDMARRSIHKGH